jgi:hypothetical protein
MLRIALCADNTLPVPLGPIADALNKICKSITFIAARERCRIKSAEIKFPDTYSEIDFREIRKANSSELAFLFTNVPYENNSFITEKVSILYSHSTIGIYGDYILDISLS